MSPKIKVAILDDHLSIVDGYLYRLRQKTDIEVVATATFGEEIESVLAEHPIDVLLLDIQVPTSEENPNPYPILHLIPKFIEQYPQINILVISMHNQRGLIKAVMDAGASGYILKDDYATILKLGEVIRTIASGGIHLSQYAYQQLFKKIPKDITLTKRQIEALSICAAYPGETTAHLAERLNIAHSTFRNTLSGAYMRLNVQNRTAAIAKIRQLGLITPGDHLIDSDFGNQ